MSSSRSSAACAMRARRSRQLPAPRAFPGQLSTRMFEDDGSILSGSLVWLSCGGLGLDQSLGFFEDDVADEPVFEAALIDVAGIGGGYLRLDDVCGAVECGAGVVGTAEPVLGHGE